MRNFAIQRIQAAERLDETFEPDPMFDFRAYTERAFGVYQGPEYHVVIEFGAEVAHLAHERDWHKKKRLVDLPDGRVRLAMDTAGLPEIASWLAGFGGKVVPIEPPELVALVRGIHERGLATVS
jgi:predicted DNA-binding transcriptional regulator YafY